MTKPRKVKLDHRTNEELTTHSNMFNGETGEILMPSDILKYLDYANKKIKFTKDEVRGLKRMSEPGLKLLGFKPLHRIKSHHHTKPSSFLYPEEKLVKGSRSLFSTLLSRCTARQVAPICWLTARKDSAPELVALIPQENVDENGVQVVPAGFHVIFLPFLDDIRNLPFSSTMRASEDQVEAAKDVVKKLRFSYNPEQFENPVLQTHWRNIEALALNRDNVEEITDYTVPNADRIQRKLGTLVDVFKDMVFPPAYDPTALARKQPAQKRAKVGDSGAGTAKKKICAEEIDMKAQALAGKVEKLTVDVLKSYLKETAGMSVTGKKKAQLVEEVYEYVGVPQP